MSVKRDRRKNIVAVQISLISKIDLLTASVTMKAKIFNILSIFQIFGMLKLIDKLSSSNVD